MSAEPIDVPFDFDVPTVPKRRRSTGPPSTRYVKCPSCTNQSVGVVRGDGDTEVIREHTKKLAGGTTLLCKGSGADVTRRKKGSE